MGIMPVRECRRRKKKECPCPARSGATPARIVTGVVVTGVVVLGTDAATTLPCRWEMTLELIIILGGKKRSQGERRRRCRRLFLHSWEYKRIRCFHKRAGSPRN